MSELRIIAPSFRFPGLWWVRHVLADVRVYAAFPDETAAGEEVFGGLAAGVVETFP